MQASIGNLYFEFIQEQSYYPFGLQHAPLPAISGTQNKYQYNGKEFNDELGLNELDYGARFYMSDIGRWGAIDPLAEKYRSYSTYNYVLNNPLKFIDPDGQDARILYNEDTKTFTIQSTIYITGKGASEDKAKWYNENKDDFFKCGTQTVDGVEYTVNFDVSYLYVEKKEDVVDAGFKAGDNLLEFTDTDIELKDQTTGQTSHPDGYIKPNNKEGVIGKSGGFVDREKNVSNMNILYHESLHLFGLSDRYKNFSANCDHGFCNDPMGGNPSTPKGTFTGNINQNHYVNWIDRFQTYKSYIKYFGDPYIQTGFIDKDKNNKVKTPIK